MAVHQYVGARYVPKFYENSEGTSEWRSGVIYEPLTIVTYNGNSYTSKRFVSADIGDPSSNPSYWVATGVFNEQVESLREDLEAAEIEIQDTNDRIDNILADERKVIFIGDSFCSGNVGGSGLGNGIYTTFCERTGLTHGVNSKVYYQGGAGFVVHPMGKTFMDLAEDAVSESGFASNEVTDIVIATAGNDGGESMSTIRDACTAVIEYLHQNYPVAKIFIAVVGGTTDGATRNQIRNVVQVACYYNSRSYVIPVYNGMLPLMFYNCYSSDGIHPNLTGCINIGYMLARAFNERTSRPQLLDFNYTANLGTISGEVTTGATFTISAHSDGLRIKCTNSPSVANAIEATYNQGCLFKIGKADNTIPFIVPNATSTSNIFVHIDSDFYLYKSSNMWVHIFGEIVIVKDDTSSATVYFKAQSSPENNTNSTLRFGNTVAELKPTGYI